MASTKEKNSATASTANSNKPKEITALHDIVGARKRLGLNQTDFWARYGTTQSGGSRYESGRFIPIPVGILLALDELGFVTEEQLANAIKAADKSSICRAKDRTGAASNASKGRSKNVSSLQDVFAARRRLGLNQSEFWARYGVTQSGGSRYESGRPIPAATGILMAIDEMGYITDEQFETARAAVKASKICKGNG